MILKALPSYLTILALTSSTLAQQNSTLGTLVQYECVPPRPFRKTQNASPQDCLAAIMTQFPSDIGTGIFHYSSNADIFQLPRSAVLRECQVVVELHETNQVQASWPFVWTLAHMLISTCTYWTSPSYANTAVTGGHVNGGPGNGIKITIGRAVKAMGEDEGLSLQIGNGTVGGAVGSN